MKVILYGVILFFHFGLFILPSPYILFVFRNFIPNDLFFAIIKIFYVTFGYWLAHHISKRIVYKRLSWWESAKDTFRNWKLI